MVDLTLKSGLLYEKSVMQGNRQGVLGVRIPLVRDDKPLMHSDIQVHGKFNSTAFSALDKFYRQTYARFLSDIRQPAVIQKLFPAIEHHFYLAYKTDTLDTVKFVAEQFHIVESAGFEVALCQIYRLAAACARGGINR